jgi:hypothetical protein
MSGLTVNGDITVTGTTTLHNVSANSVYANIFTGSSISINGGEIMTRIPDSLDFQLFGNQSSTGVIEFGGLSGNSLDNTRFDLGITKGWIVDNTTLPEQPNVKYINYSGSTGLNPSGITLNFLLSNPVTYIGLSGNSSNDIVQSSKPFTQSERRDLLELGVVVHVGNSTVTVVNNHPTIGIDPTQQLYDLIDGLGFFNLDGGNVYTYNGANLNIDKSGGDIFANGSNYVLDSKNPHVKYLTSGSSITFKYRLRDSTEFSGTTIIDTNNYDLNGVLTPVPTNKFTIQRIVLFTSNQTRIQYGQNVYDSIDDAEASLSTEDFIIEKNINENSLLRGFLITKEGTTDLSNNRLSKFIEANHFGHAEDTVVGNVHRTEIINHASTGLRDGGLLTADSATTFRINSGSGIVVDNTTNPNNPTLTEVIWDNLNGNTITALNSDVITFIGIDDLGVVNQFPLSSPPSQSDKRRVILLGAIAHSDKTTITNIYNGPTHIVSPINQHEDLTSSIGTFSINGNHVGGVGGTLELTKTLGSSYFYGGNFQTDPSNPSTITTNLISGSTTPAYPLVYASGTDVLGLFGYTIDPNNYDPNGLGVLTPVSVNKYVPHRIWHLPINNLLVFQYGQTEYNSLNLAIDGFSTEDYVEPPGLSIGAYLISVVITKDGETDLSNTSTTKFIQQGKFAGTGGGGGSIADSLQTAYNNSTQPEIITDSVRGSVDLRVGSGSDSDNLITFQSSGGTINAWVNGVGDSSFNSVTSTIISGGTFYGDGSNLTGVVSSDSYVTGSTLNGNILELSRNGGLSTLTTDLSQFIDNTDNFVTGGTMVGNTLVLNRTNALSAVTVDMSQFVDDTNSFVTGFTYNNSNQLTLGRNGGLNDLSVFINEMSGLTVNGNTSLSGLTIVYGDTPISAAIQPGVDNTYDLGAPSFRWREIFSTNVDISNALTTEFLYVDNTSSFNGDVDITGNTTNIGNLLVVGDVSGTTFYGDGSNLTGIISTDNYTTGATLNGNILVFNRTDALSAYTVDLSSITTSGGTGMDNYVTDGLLSGNTLVLNRTSPLSAVTIDLSSLSVTGSTAVSIIHSITAPNSSFSGSTWVRTTDYESFIYDVIRSKWLPNNTNSFEGSRSKNNQTDVFLRTVDGSPYNLTPYTLTKDITICSVLGETSTSDSFNILISTGTTIPSDVIYNLPIISDVVNSEVNVNVDVSSGGQLYLYMSGTTVDYPKSTVYYKYR